MFESPSPKHCRIIRLFIPEVTVTLTFALGVTYWWGPTSLLSLRVLAPSIANLSTVLVLKVMVTLTITFALGVIYWWGPTSLLRVLAPSIAKLSSFLVLKVLVTMTFALRIIYWWGPTSLLFEGPNHKHYRIASLFGTKGHSDLDLWLKGNILLRSIFPISLIVLGVIIANGFLLYVTGTGPLVTPGALKTLVRGPLGNAAYQISKA